MRFGDFFALDLGTTKFCLARLCKPKGSALPFIETVSVEAGGMHRGMLSNMEAASSALSKLLETGERQFGADISRVVVGIAGSHLSSKKVAARIRIPAAKVEPELLIKLADQVMCDQKDSLREIIHCVPIAYRLDDREWITSPIGFSGQFLHGEFFLVEADRHYLGDVVQLCNNNGLEVKRLVAEPLASASVTADLETKRIGVVVADIGGGTTDGIIYQDEKPISSFTINIGGKMMTRDLSIGLGLPYAEAEKVKLRFGLGTGQPEEAITALDIAGKPRLFTQKAVYPILAPRIYELGKLLEKHVLASRCQLGAGLVLTGGGSDITDICPFLSKALNMRVTRIEPRLRLDDEAGDQPNQPSGNLASKYATASGLLYTELSRQIDDKKLRKNRWAGHYFGQFVNWLRELS